MTNKPVEIFILTTNLTFTAFKVIFYIKAKIPTEPKMLDFNYLLRVYSSKISNTIIKQLNKGTMFVLDYY